jgi:hypothetical protein
VAARAFGDVGANAVGTSHNLSADGLPRKPVSAENNIPNSVCKLLGQLVDPEIPKMCPAHDLTSHRNRRSRLPTADC